MKPKYKNKIEEYRTANRSAYASAELSPSSQAIKSPSPDKKSANIISSTRSPELFEIKHLQLPDKDHMVSSWHSQKEYHFEKPFPMSTPPKAQHNQIAVSKIEETQGSTNNDYKTIDIDPHYTLTSNSRVRNTKIEIVAEGTPEDFESKHLSRIQQLSHSDSMELDYIKLLKSKQETIKELKEIIDMIKRNNTSYEEVEDIDKAKELKEKVIELNAEVRQLKIENQHLLNVIEKSKKSHSSALKEQILQRQIKELKITIRERQHELNEATTNFQRQTSSLQQQLRRLQTENQSLLRILKQKEQVLGNSSLSVQSKNSDKQKLSLVKIREQYHQNLKLMKDNFYAEMQELSGAYHCHLEELEQKTDQLNNKIVQLELFRNELQRKIPREAEKMDAREEYHKEKARHQEIESLMLEKYSKYENQIGEQKKTNDRLIQELIKANKTIEDLNQRSTNFSQELNRIKESQSNQAARRLNEQKTNLVRTNSTLERDNLALRAHLEEAVRSKEQAIQEYERKIQEYERKIQVILMDYQKQHKEQKSKLEHTIHLLNEELKQQESKFKDIIDTYERDKNDTEEKIKQAIDIYNRENEALKAKVHQKSNEYYQLSLELQNLKKDHSNCNEHSVNLDELENLSRQCKQLSVRCQNLQNQVGSLNTELMELDSSLKQKQSYIRQLQEKVNQIEQQKQSLSKKHSEVQIKNNDLTIQSSQKQLSIIELQKQIEELQKQLEINQEKYNLTLNTLQQQQLNLNQTNQTLTYNIHQLQQEVEAKIRIIDKLEEDIQIEQSSRLNKHQPIEQDLRELKRLVCECFLNTNNHHEKEIVEEIYKLNHLLEQKLEENLKLNRELEQLKEQLREHEGQKQILNEKIALLEQNNSIYQRQLKERRHLYDQLLQEKSRVEKQILLNRKIKLEQNNIDTHFKTNILEITDRIDRLLDLEKQRNENMKSFLVVREFNSEER